MRRKRKERVEREKMKQTGIVSFSVPVGVGCNVLLLLLLMMLLLVAAGEHLLEKLKLRTSESGKKGEEKKERR